MLWKPARELRGRRVLDSPLMIRKGRQFTVPARAKSKLQDLVASQKVGECGKKEKPLSTLKLGTCLCKMLLALR